MEIFDRRLILVVGKGGVGRTTVATAIAAECARRGRKTLLFQTNAADRVGRFYDQGPIGTEVVGLAPNLSAVNTNPAAAIAEYGLMILRFRTVYEMVFENRVTKTFLRAIPGLDDYALLGKAWFHTTETHRGKQVWDTIVFDMPASGHSVSMLRVPKVIVDTVPEGPLTRDARSVAQLLADPDRTAAVLVTLAEEMPVNEAIELEAKLGELGIVPQQIIVNQIYPEHFPPGSPVARVLETITPATTAPLAALAAHGTLSRDRRMLNAHYLLELRRRTKIKVAELPILFASVFGRAQIEQLAAMLPKL
ncbi:MAG: ArsA family ATPase [Proteobacteria bacterium]|nr:ArsA family ATPase [Pseudomonadota bacterium]